MILIGGGGIITALLGIIIVAIGIIIVASGNSDSSVMLFGVLLLCAGIAWAVLLKPIYLYEMG